ncbi:MAG: hypothetical protein QG622_657, partial [Actinomycetota bacterium]|nr:hypothetical protein [Actinomycetota bacterium]
EVFEAVSVTLVVLIVGEVVVEDDAAALLPAEADVLPGACVATPASWFDALASWFDVLAPLDVAEAGASVAALASPPATSPPAT